MRKLRSFKCKIRMSVAVEGGTTEVCLCGFRYLNPTFEMPQADPTLSKRPSQTLIRGYTSRHARSQRRFQTPTHSFNGSKTTKTKNVAFRTDWYFVQRYRITRNILGDVCRKHADGPVIFKPRPSRRHVKTTPTLPWVSWLIKQLASVPTSVRYVTNMTVVRW